MDNIFDLIRQRFALPPSPQGKAICLYYRIHLLSVVGVPMQRPPKSGQPIRSYSGSKAGHDFSEKRASARMNVTSDD